MCYNCDNGKLSMLLKEIKDIWQKDRAFSPKIKNSVRNKLLQGWKLAIKKTLA